MKEIPVTIEKIETGEKQPGLIVAYKPRSPRKVILSNIFGSGNYDCWSGDKRGFVGFYYITRTWNNIKRCFKSLGGISLHGIYIVYPAEIKAKSKFKEIKL